MAEGLRIRNNGYILQIDGTYQNSELIQSGTIVLNQVDANGRGWYSTISFPAGKVLPLVAFRTTSPGIYWRLINSNTMQIFAGQPTTQPQPTVTFYIFGEPNDPDIGGVGLIVRNRTTGKVVYNSNRKYLRIIDAVVGQINPDASWSGSYPGKAVAICQNMRPSRVRVQTGGTAQQPIFVISLHSGCMYTPDTSTAVITHRQVAAFTGFGGNQDQIVNMLDANYFVIDVTAY